MEMKRLPKAEVCFYFIVWMFGIIYSLYHVFLIGDKLVNSLPKEYFTEGWSFIQRKKDNLDDEWKLWLKLVQNVLPLWFVLHYVGVQIIRRMLLKSYYYVIPLWYFLITSMCLFTMFNMQFYVLYLIQPLLFFIILCFDCKPLMWSLSFVIMAALSHSERLWEKNDFFTVEQENILLVSLLWQHLRCLSFALSDIPNKLTLKSFIYFVGYSFYLPCFFLGPILLFEDFLPGMKFNPQKSNIVPTTLRLLLNNLRYLFWLYITEFALHYIYVNVLLIYVTIFDKKSVWLMYGLGYAMGQFFFHKYVVIYGLSISWARAEGYETPRPPKCVAHIHLYSDMWRYFDEGYYLFIKRYIYNVHLHNKSATSIWHKIKVSFGCFVFVFMWHGFNYNTFVWTFLNFCALSVEILARKFTSTDFYKELQEIMGYENERRIEAFVSAPLTVFSAISNFYFLGGTNVGNAYFKYLLRGSAASTLCLWFFAYSFCQISMELRPYLNNNIRNKIKYLSD